MRRENSVKTTHRKDKISKADSQELQRFKKAVHEEVVKPIEKRATAQKEAVARARTRYVR